MTREEEIIHLCAEHGIEIRWSNGSRGRAWRRDRRVVLPPVRGEMSYLLALHEIGHIIGENPRLKLDQEVAAWEWALAHYDREPTHACWRGISNRLLSYWGYSERRKRVQRSERFEQFTLRIAAIVVHGG